MFVIFSTHEKYWKVNYWVLFTIVSFSEYLGSILNKIIGVYGNRI